MKPFRFSLQALYIVRERNEREKLEKYSQSVREYQKSLQRLKAAEKELDECWERIRDFQKKGGHADDLAMYERWRIKAEELCQLRFDELMLAQKNMERALDEWLNAKKEKEVVEKFQARQKSKYNLECRREEQKLLDEMKSRMGAMSELTETF